MATHSEQRWRIGHHGFFVLTQGLVLALSKFRRHVASGNLTDAGRYLEAATCLMHGSASVFRFTGDFSEDDYNLGVRPTMPDRFSGIMSEDHAVMIRIVPSSKGLPIELSFSHRRFKEATAGAIDAHTLVCAQFGGNDEPSLRMSQESRLSAVQVLKQFRRNRLRLLN
ncbi:MAG: hypothetical protein Q8R28_04680 [Dehalococcoidia bacterium]|nr:hypothetical protein [Dehalococcoidia bacterium]